MSEIGVLFDDIHTYTKWGLRLLQITIGPPEPKSMLVNIEGGDGVLDLSAALTGDIAYNTRNLELSFDAPNCDYYKWPGLVSEIMDELHGRRKKIVLDNDPGYYYDGLVTVDNKKTNAVFAEITIIAQCQPYKMERFSSLEDWEWDTFDFESGIIREYKDLRVDGELALTIAGRRKRIVPAFIVESDDGSGLKVKFNGSEYDLPDGTSRVLNIVIGEGEYTLDFIGSGTVSVDYRGGRL